MEVLASEVAQVRERLIKALLAEPTQAQTIVEQEEEQPKQEIRMRLATAAMAFPHQ